VIEIKLVCEPDIVFSDRDGDVKLVMQDKEFDSEISLTLLKSGVLKELTSAGDELATVLQNK
jgi:hypothetical protein